MNFDYRIINFPPQDESRPVFGRVELQGDLRIDFQINTEMCRNNNPLYIYLRGSKILNAKIQWVAMDKHSLEDIIEAGKVLPCFKLVVYNTGKIGYSGYSKVDFTITHIQEGLHLKVSGTQFKSTDSQVIEEGLLVNNMDLMILNKRSVKYRQNIKTQENKCLI